jgi:hypothetical protein
VYSCLTEPAAAGTAIRQFSGCVANNEPSSSDGAFQALREIPSPFVFHCGCIRGSGFGSGMIRRGQRGIRKPVNPIDACDATLLQWMTADASRPPCSTRDCTS